ncbi:L,D-transpeptidase family protein [Scytonema sp. UIC 10036]|uniref:L,D-transpeptidase n=1 Tax=Scytonema sp. UIC 10036 TaxID=2304196 RepID=UPI0012DAA5D1|nr:L,D-transpeptidase [Scytonema sp. UIC 10036]MUG93103.1 L,D-transpeptidase family protein [Scytonema sp. UIC 10036]
MFKQLFKIFFLLCVLCVYSSSQAALAAEDESQDSLQNSVTEPIDTKINDLITLPLHLKINLRQRQVTVYQGKNLIKSYPVAVGRRGWETPVGNFRVRDMLVNPTWIHPKTGKAIPGGDAKNPLGNYWIGFWTNGKDWVGFHGTPNPESVGTAASHGCIRMYNQDIEELFKLVNIGTPVTVER